MMKDNWLNLPGTVGQFKRFFLGAKDQSVPLPAAKLTQKESVAA
jgi:hypothetical protein